MFQSVYFLNFQAVMFQQLISLHQERKSHFQERFFYHLVDTVNRMNILLFLSSVCFYAVPIQSEENLRQSFPQLLEKRKHILTDLSTFRHVEI